MPNGEITNPNIDLRTIPVSEAACRERTQRLIDKVEQIGRETNKRLARIEVKVDSHAAWHQGAERKASSVTASIRTIGTIVAMAATMGTALWALARTIG